jgi:hypothetical protein
MGLALTQDRPQMPLAEDQHPVGDLSPGSEHEPLRGCIRSRTAGRDLHGLDASAGQDRVKRRGELPRPITDKEPEVRCAVPEVHQEVAGLLGGPGAVGMGGDPEDVHVTALDLDDE